jgi:hypothetical protein
MDLFICWSGPASREIATLLRTWLRDVIQKLRPFFSEDDIRRGVRWRSELARRLAETHFGIICLTPENLQAEWILFEAGALSKNSADGGSVTALLCGIESADVVGPLNQFQHTAADRDSVFKLMQDINAMLPIDQQLEEDRLKRAFDTHWPTLDEGIRRALQKLRTNKPHPPTKRPVDEMVAELLVLVRQLGRPDSRDVRAPNGREPEGSALAGITGENGFGQSGDDAKWTLDHKKSRRREQASSRNDLPRGRPRKR